MDRNRRAAVVVACLAALCGLIALVVATRPDHVRPSAQVTTGSGAASSSPVASGTSSPDVSDSAPAESPVASSVETVPPVSDAEEPSDSQSTTSETESDPAPTPPAPVAPDAILALGAPSSVGEIVAVNPDGSGSNLLFQGQFWSAAWAPDHHAVATIDYAQSEVHIFTLADSSDRVVVPAGDPMSPWRPRYNLRWSPDERTIAYACDIGMCAVDVDTGTTYELADRFGLRDPDNVNFDGTPSDYLFGSWAPDGRQFSYLVVTTTDANSSISYTPMIADVTTGEHWKIGASLYGGGPLLFTSDGQSVFWFRYRWFGRNYCACQLVLLPIHGGDSTDVPGSWLDPIDRSPSGDEFLQPSTLAGDPPPVTMFRLDGSSRQVSTGRDYAVSW